MTTLGLPGQILPPFRKHPLLLWLLILALTACLPVPGREEAPSRKAEETLNLRQPEQLEPQSGEGRLRVVASTSIVADLAAIIGGEHIELSVLMPRAVDPHSFQPSPGDLQALYRADLVLLNGFGLEDDLAAELSPVSAQVPMISLSDGLAPRTFAGESGSDEDGEHGQGRDPHVWFDPQLVSHWVDRVEQAFARLDPLHAPDYQILAASYRNELAALDSWIRTQVDFIPVERRKLVLDHLVLGYFAARYNFDVVQALVPAYSSAAEPSPRELASLVEILSAERIPAIFIGMEANPRLAKQLAADLGIEVVMLYTGSLGPSGGPAATYLDMMQYNVLAIRHALAPE